MTQETFSSVFTAGANSSGTETLLTSDYGHDVQVKEVEITIEGDATTGVSVGTFQGESRLAPKDGDVAGGGQQFSLQAEASVGPSDSLEARWSNTTGTAREVIVLVHGEVEG
jgi:hypothetical protein